MAESRYEKMTDTIEMLDQAAGELTKYEFSEWPDPDVGMRVVLALGITVGAAYSVREEIRRLDSDGKK